MTGEDREIPEERIYFFDEQEVAVEEFDAEGYMLDMGGGGEGIIGRLKDGEVLWWMLPSRERAGMRQ